MEYKIRLRTPHPEQSRFISSTAKRKVIRAGRRGGKTVGAATLAVEYFLNRRRVLYATPTADQITRFWFEVKRALQEPIDAGVLYKNETEHMIEMPGTETRIRAKTAWNADTLRGDYGDLLILDEWQLMNEDAWEIVGAPMLLDNNGDVVFIYTPPSLKSASVSKAQDKRHAAKLFKKAAADTSGRWATFHFSSRENPHISMEALAEITKDMTHLAYEQEIEAQDKDSVPGALWNADLIEKLRVTSFPQLVRIGVALDPSATSKDTSDEAGIIVGGIDDNGHGYLLDDPSLRGTPHEWATAAVSAYHRYFASVMLAESNQGGEMVSLTIGTIEHAPPVKLIHASLGKVARAEPVAAKYEQGLVHHVGYFPKLEDEMCSYVAGAKSPNRLDAMVHLFTELMLTGGDAIGEANYANESTWRFSTSEY